MDVTHPERAEIHIAPRPIPLIIVPRRVRRVAPDIINLRRETPATIRKGVTHPVAMPVVRQTIDRVAVQLRNVRRRLSDFDVSGATIRRAVAQEIKGCPTDGRFLFLLTGLRIRLLAEKMCAGVERITTHL